jgi:hypothetical protein
MMIEVNRAAIDAIAETAPPEFLDEVIILGKDSFGIEIDPEAYRNFEMRRFAHETISDVIVQAINRRFN